MKFCIISNDLHTVRNFRGDLLNSIAAQGYAIHILAPNIELYPEDQHYFQDLGFQLHSYPLQKMGTNPVADSKTILAIYQHLRAIQPTKVLSYTIKPVIYGTIAAYLAKVPERYILLSGLGFAFQDDQSAGRLKYVKQLFNQIFRFALRQATAVIFQNADDLALVRELKHLPARIPTYIVNGSGVNTEKFAPQPLLLDEHNHPQPIFLMVGRLLKDKGVYEYIAAAKQIKQHYPQAHFHLVGWIDENPAAIAQEDLEEWIASGLIQYWGKLSDVRQAICQANIFVLPSYREGIPRSVLEAMAMRRAIITTDAPGCKETVIDGQNGFKVPVRDADALAQAMQRLIEQPVQIEWMAANSLALVQQRYEVKQVNQQMLQAMQFVTDSSVSTPST